jgi:hypothetical protein
MQNDKVKINIINIILEFTKDRIFKVREACIHLIVHFFNSLGAEWF